MEAHYYAVQFELWSNVMNKCSVAIGNRNLCHIYKPVRLWQYQEVNEAAILTVRHAQATHILYNISVGIALAFLPTGGVSILNCYFNAKLQNTCRLYTSHTVAQILSIFCEHCMIFQPSIRISASTDLAGSPKLLKASQ